MLGSDAFAVVASTREENLKREKAALREDIIRMRREAEDRARVITDLESLRQESEQARSGGGWGSAWSWRG